MIEHLSYSSISKYLTCAASWRFHYLDKIPSAPSPALAFGSAWHGTVESLITSPGDPGEVFRANLNKALEKEQVSFGLDEGPETLLEDGLNMLKSGDVLQAIQAIKPKRNGSGYEIEKPVRLSVPGVPVPMIGFIDVITEDNVPGDIKTSSRSWTGDQALKEMQPLFYLAALNQAGIPTPGLRFRHYVFVKTKTPKVQVIETAYKFSGMIFLFQMITKVWRGIELGIFPENPAAWMCTPGTCDFWKVCRGKYE